MTSPDTTDQEGATALLEALSETLPQLVLLVHDDGQAELVNGRWTAFTGLDLEATRRAGWTSVLDADDATRARALVREAIAGGDAGELEARLRGDDGHRAWFRLRLARVREGRCLVVADEIEDRRRVEQALRHSEAALRESTSLLRAICDTTSDFVYAKDRDGRMLLANPATLAHIGKRATEVLGRTDVEFLHDEAAGRAVMENDRRVMERGEPEVLEEVVPDRSGARRVFLSTKTPYRDLRGRIVGLLGISREITERKQVEDALLQREAQLRARATELETILESLAEGVIVYDVDGNVVRMNAIAARLVGGDAQRAVERRPGTPLALLSEDGRSMSVEEMPFYRAIHGETSSGAVVGFPHEGAEPTWVTVNAAPLVDGDGQITGAVVTIVDTTDRKRAEEALREADRRKSEFLGVLSHELRNPLAPIRNSLFVLERAPDGSEQARRAKAVIDRQVRHMSRLVDDLLDVTRISRGKIQLHRERLDLGELVRRTLDDHRLECERAHIALEVAIDPRPLWVDGDATRLAQIVGNLLQNALKFTEPGGAVKVSVEPRDGATSLRVADTGLGIDAALLPSIFEPFMQDDRTLARSRGGLGLGLALVKGLIELHGGAVEAKSAGSGRGSEFTVTLPLLEAPARGDEAALATLAARRRVLIIEDNVDAAESLREALLFGEHDVEVAHDGREGLAKMRAFHPEVVLCDIGLPGIDGYDVARTARSDPALRDAYFVALSGYALPEDVRRAKAAGFDRHLAKPPDLDELDRVLASARHSPD